MVLIVAPRFLKLFGKHVHGMALFPFILVRRPHLKYDPVLINHELIHLRQQLETGILPFYLLYLANYLTNLMRYRNHWDAYTKIAFEREAYAFEKNLSYLESRKTWAFFRYF